MLRLRNHASLLVWLNGSDYLPSDVESAYLEDRVRNALAKPHSFVGFSHADPISGASA